LPLPQAKAAPCVIATLDFRAPTGTGIEVNDLSDHHCVIELSPDRIAAGAGAKIVQRGGGGRPERALVDSREVRGGELFVGLPGEHSDGGEFAAGALVAGAWGVLVAQERAGAVAETEEAEGWVFAVPDPLAALQALARTWRRELGCSVVGITGSTGKTSVKDICRAMLPFRVHASPENYNTEIGLPLAILGAPPETEVLVLEMAMRGKGQIAELCEIAEPDVAAITNIGPVHLELLGTLEAITEAKAEILTGLRDRGTAVVPSDAEALEPHIHERLVVITFGPGGEVFAHPPRVEGESMRVEIATPDGTEEFGFPFDEAYNLTNALAAVAIGIALHASLAAMAERAAGIVFSRLRGEVLQAGDVVIVNDSYNANPLSMRAALDHLASMQVRGRRIAVLGEMKELGPEARAYHRDIGAHARDLGVGPILGVGELARDYAPDGWVPDARAAITPTERLVEPGDAVLIKGSRSVGLELLTDELVARLTPPAR
jgi:UDP-N-acetylmuramoyl-tripeptide--D-alanyl-D-alanine ligase